MRSVTAPNREPDDAPSPKSAALRRRRLLLVAVAVAALNVVVALVFVGRRAPAPVQAPPPPPAPRVEPVVAEPVVPEPPPAVVTEPAPAPPRVPARTRPPPARRRSQFPPVVIDDVVGRDRAATAAVERGVRRHLGNAGVEAAGAQGYAVTLRADAEHEGAGITVRCGASLARLPGRNVVGALKARADVEGEGVTPAELTSLVRDQLARYGKAIRDNNITAD